VGTAALFGAENEELTRIQTRLQAVMAITIGLQQVSEALNKDSYFSVVLLSKAKTMLAAANSRVATTLGISTLAAKAFTIAITGGLIVAVTAIIALVSHLVSKQQEAKKAAQEFNKSVASAAAEPVSAIKKLSSEWKALGNNIDEKKKFIDNNKKAFDELGVAINSVSDAENLLVSGTQSFIKAQIARAKAAALLDSSVYKEALNKSITADSDVDREASKFKKFTGKQPTFKTLSDGSPQVIQGSVALQNAMTERYEANKRLNNLYEQAAEYEKQGLEEMAKVGITETKKYAEGTVGAINEAIKLKKEALENVTNKSDYNKIDAEIKALEKKRENITGPAKEPKEAKEPYDAQRELQRQLLEINRQTSDLLFAQRDENLQKTLAAIDREKDAEIEKIKQKEQEIVDKYNQANKDKKGFKAVSSISQIDPELAKQNEQAVQELTDAYAAKRKKTQEDYITEMTRMAAEAADQRVKIENDYQDDIKQAREAGMENYALLLEEERDKKVSETTASMITELEAYKLATNDQLIISKETTEKLIEMIRQRVQAELAAGKLTKENAQQILDSLDASNSARGVTNNPFQNLIDGLQKYKTAKDAIASAKAGGATATEIAKLEDAANKTLESTAEAAGVALQGVVNILSQAVDGFSELGLLSQEQEKTANEVIGMVTGAANLAMGIASGNPVQIIQGSVELLVNAFKLFDKKSKDIEKAQKQAKQNVEDLTRAYDKLSRAVDKALGTDVYKSQREQVANLQKQIAEYYRLIELEEQKKKKKQDQAAIADWQSTIDELTGQIEDITDNIAESIAQTSVKDLASELADSLVAAFEQGADAAEAMGDVIDNVIKRAVVNSLKLRYLEKPLEGIIDAFAADMESGGGLSNAEADKFRKAIEALGTDFYAAFEQANQVLDGMFEGAKDANTQSGIRGDVANMTEQTGSALVGQLAAMRLNVAAILATSKNTGEAMTRIFATMERIRENTEYCRLLERIDSNIQYLKQNGIDVK